MHANLNLGHYSIRDICVQGGHLGQNCPPGREHLPGWGALVEVPAVLELLDLVAAGHLDAADARRLLAQLGERTPRVLDPHGCGTEGCVDGNHCRGEFEEDRLREMLRRERADTALASEPATTDAAAVTSTRTDHDSEPATAAPGSGEIHHPLVQGLSAYINNLGRGTDEVEALCAFRDIAMLLRGGIVRLGGTPEVPVHRLGAVSLTVHRSLFEAEFMAKFVTGLLNDAVIEASQQADRVLELAKKYQDAVNANDRFIQERCRRPGAGEHPVAYSVSVETLYAAYTAWCGSQKLKPLAPIDHTLAMPDGVTVQAIPKARRYQGLALKHDA
ncbi:hypothetical protein ACWC5I_06070 [Kitasatospora sp. NPDC001574]